jgi:hypothetical protein
LLKKMADLYCKNDESCCHVEPNKVPQSYDDCVASAIHELATQSTKLKAKSYQFDSKDAEECLSFTKNTEENFRPQCFRSILSACIPYHVSERKKPLESCETMADCEQPSLGTVSCAEDLPATGTNASKFCQQRVPSKPGENLEGKPCGGHYGTVVDCGFKTSWYCDRTTHLCTKFATMGKLCVVGDSGCESGYTCIPSVDTSPEKGTCQKLVSLGEICAEQNPCGSGYCDKATNQCTAKKELGKACKEGTECFDGFCDKGTCQLSEVGKCFSNYEHGKYHLYP